jgi:hypothetical protein
MDKRTQEAWSIVATLRICFLGNVFWTKLPLGLARRSSPNRRILDRMRTVLRTALSVICLFLSACKADTPNVPQSPARMSSTTGTVVFWTQPVERGIEGHITFFLVNSSGSVVEEKHLRPGASAPVSLPPGSQYQLVSYVRDCHENCGDHSLGPPADECRAAFTLKAGETLYARRLADPDSWRPRPRCMLTITAFPLTDGERR